MIKKITLICITLILFSCGKNNPVLNEEVYTIKKAEKEKSAGYINVDGKVAANDTKKVFVDKKLKVKEVFIKQGDYVKKGQVLMTFDETERNNIKRNLEKEKLSLSKLKRDYLVEKELNKIGGSSDNYVKDLSEQIKSQELSIETLEEDLEKTAEEIISPVSGTITTLLAQENYFVNTDDPLLELTDLSDVKIILEVPEYDVKNIKIGQELIIKPEVFEKKKSYNGVITDMSKISKVSEDTSENVLEVEVKPYEKIPHIVPGFKVSATIYVNSFEHSIFIPKTALQFKNNKYYIYIVDSNNKIQERDVIFKDTKGEEIEIKSGLEVGENYIITPKNSLKNNDTINVIKK